MRTLVTWMSGLCAAAALAGFFLPWVRIDLREPAVVSSLRETAEGAGLLGTLGEGLSRVAVEIRRGTETLTGELPRLAELPRQVSGWQIPRAANQEQARLALALLELFTGRRQRLDEQSYAVYFVPGLAVLAALLLANLGGQRLAASAVLLLCGAIAAVGFWKISTVRTDPFLSAIAIGPGLWLSLGAYAGLALTASMSLAVGPARR